MDSEEELLQNEDSQSEILPETIESWIFYWTQIYSSIQSISSLYLGYQQNAPPIKNTTAYNFFVNNQNPIIFLRLWMLLILASSKNFAGFWLLTKNL